MLHIMGPLRPLINPDLVINFLYRCLKIRMTLQLSSLARSTNPPQSSLKTKFTQLAGARQVLHPALSFRSVNTAFWKSHVWHQNHFPPGEQSESGG